MANPLVQELLIILDNIDPIGAARIRCFDELNDVILGFHFDTENKALFHFDELLKTGSKGNASELSGEYRFDLDVHHRELGWITRRSLFTSSETFQKIYNSKKP